MFEMLHPLYTSFSNIRKIFSFFFRMQVFLKPKDLFLH